MSVTYGAAFVAYIVVTVIIICCIAWLIAQVIKQ